MSAQRLSERSIRRIATATGLPIARAWSHGGYTMSFFTLEPAVPDGHRHGWFDKKTGEWGWDDGGPHYTSCSDLENW
jgi:hypothetical protein